MFSALQFFFILFFGPVKFCIFYVKNLPRLHLNSVSLSKSSSIQCHSLLEKREYLHSQLTYISLWADCGFSQRLTLGCRQLSSFHWAMSFRYHEEIVEKDWSNLRSPSQRISHQKHEPASIYPSASSSDSYVVLFSC